MTYLFDFVFHQIIPEKSGLLKHALPNDCRTDDEADFFYQRTNEKLNPTNTRIANEASRPPASPVRQQTNSQAPPSNVSSGLAAAVNNASKQETMMPGHRPREKASSMYESNHKLFISYNFNS